MRERVVVATKALVVAVAEVTARIKYRECPEDTVVVGTF
jgi:hypothetical protein